MSESGKTNIEAATELHKASARELPHIGSRTHITLEVIEALVLALVAITTAWSGYEAARWDGVQSERYGRSFRMRIEGQALELKANQERMYDAATVVEWIKAEAHGETKLAELFERRFLPEFRPAFEAWKGTDPLHNPSAPAGPAQMPEYRLAMADEAAQKNREATELFEQGTAARERADNYVRLTVFLATVLLLTAISQRFPSLRVRTALAVLALLMLFIPIWIIFTLPRT